MSWKGVLRVGLVILVLLGGFGCVKKLPMPEHTNLEPIEIDLSEQLDSVRFEKAIATIKRGTVIGAFPSGSKGWDICNYWAVGEIYWTGWSAFVGQRGDEFGNTFYETLKSLGYNVVGDPSVMFDTRREASKAKYSVAGRILDIKFNVCKHCSRWDGRYIGKDSGETYIKVEWNIFSNIEKRTVLKFITNGYYQEPNGIFDGYMRIFIGAFANAIENLAANEEFYNLVARKSGDTNVGLAGPVGERIVIPRVDPYTRELGLHAGKVLDGVVTLPYGDGHGSGFIISRNGYIITNEHVVGDSTEVPVNFGNGLELVGTVVKKDPVHDVALVKVGLNRATPIPIQPEYPKTSTTVYAIGAPIDPELEKTITKGIVSGIRYFPHLQSNVIQSDASIEPGNSGGPLVDENGNVVGIADFVVRDAGRKTNLNFFLTIKEALEALNIEIGEKP